MGWAKDRAAQLKSREADQQRQREWQIEKRKIVAQRAPLVWEQFVQAVQHDVDEFNATVGTDQGKQVLCKQEPNGNLVVRRDTYPALRLDVALDPQLLIVRCESHKRVSDLSSPNRLKQELLLDADDAGNVYVRLSGRCMTPEQLSEELLKPLL